MQTPGSVLVLVLVLALVFVFVLVLMVVGYRVWETMLFSPGQFLTLDVMGLYSS